MNRLLTKILFVLKITTKPVVRAYEGYGDADDILILGHVLKLSPVPRKKFRRSFVTNLFSLIRLFIVRPKKNALVRLQWFDEIHETTTETDGLFRFEFKPKTIPKAGWHSFTVSYIGKDGQVITSGDSKVFIPHHYQYSFISDIDDTFLISHSSNIFKRLFVLFTKNARTRQPFKNVVSHYKLLSSAGATTDTPNPFFYVSSSEWNLYEYIREFCRKEQLPKGILLLSQMKKISELLKTGQGKHSGKYIRIVRILKSFPNHKYVLLGDNSQMDPEIYNRVVKDFPGKIFAVYIRNVNKRNDARTRELIGEIKSRGVETCYFIHSSEAMTHSAAIGLAGEL